MNAIQLLFYLSLCLQDNQIAITHNIKANAKKKGIQNEMKSLPLALTAHWHYCRGSFDPLSCCCKLAPPTLNPFPFFILLPTGTYSPFPFLSAK